MSATSWSALLLALLPADATTVALSGLDTYHDPVAIKQMAYAKPELAPRVIGKSA